MNPSDLSACVGEMWRSMSDEQKNVYRKVADRIRNDPLHDVDYKSFNGI